MPRAYHRSLLMTLALVAGCPSPATQPAKVVGADCNALIEAARRAASCDPELGRLADALERAPDEMACRQQARRLLAPPEPNTRIVSVYAGNPDSSPPPLTDAERDALRQLELPAILVVRPDVPSQPGIPATKVAVDGRPIVPDPDGRFLAYLVPGTHSLRIRHADGSQDACLEIETCDRIELTAHGSKLAPNERVSPGACEEPGPEVAATKTD